MARSYETALAELENKRGELEALSTISEEEVCYVYNVDSKSEIVKILSDEIETLEREVEYLTPLDWSNDGKSSVSCPLKPSDSAPLC